MSALASNVVSVRNDAVVHSLCHSARHEKSIKDINLRLLFFDRQSPRLLPDDGIVIYNKRSTVNFVRSLARAEVLCHSDLQWIHDQPAVLGVLKC
jgi:hypothetical protein